MCSNNVPIYGKRILIIFFAQKKLLLKKDAILFSSHLQKHDERCNYACNGFSLAEESNLLVKRALAVNNNV